MAEHIWKKVPSGKVMVQHFKCQGCGRTMKCRAGFDSIDGMARHLGYPVECPRPVLSTKELRALQKVVRDWVTKYQVRAPESAVWRHPHDQEALPELAATLCKLVGFYEDGIR